MGCNTDFLKIVDNAIGMSHFHSVLMAGMAVHALLVLANVLNVNSMFLKKIRHPTTIH